MKHQKMVGKQSGSLTSLNESNLILCLRTPLTFVPIGLLEKSEFFDIGNDSDPTQLGVMYKTWQHNFKYGIKKFMSKTGQRGFIRRKAFNGIARTLGGVPLGYMERYARRKGREHERVLDKIKAQYW